MIFYLRLGPIMKNRFLLLGILGLTCFHSAANS